MLHLCFVYVLFVFRLYFFYVCQNPKILFSQNKILDFCLTQVLRKQNVCQTQVKHRANIVSHNSAHLQRRWKHVRDSWDTWLPEWFVDSFVFCWWVVLCFIVDSLAFCLWWVSDVFMIHLCLLLCCVYVVLCWFFTSLVYVRLLASDLVPIDEALWVYLTHIKVLGCHFMIFYVFPSNISTPGLIKSASLRNWRASFKLIIIFACII